MMNVSKQKICGVVVTFQPADDFPDIVNTYIDQIDLLIVIDNTEGPVPESLLSIAEHERVIVHRNNENIGIAAALNTGAQLAIDRGYNYMLTMDQDSRLRKNTVNNLVYYTEKYSYNLNNVGVMAPFPSDNSYTQVPEKEVEEQLCVLTSGNLVNLDIYSKVGGYCNQLFIDKVDDEYCLRLHSNRYHVLRVNAVIMDHNLGNITHHNLFCRPQVTTNHSPRRRYYITRNACHVSKLYQNEFPQYKKEQIEAFFYEFSKIVLFEKDKLKKISSIIQGYIDFKKGKFGKFEGLHR